MKKIPLTQGLFTVVDDDDYERFSHLNWYVRKGRGTFYAQRKCNITGKYRNVQLHRCIMNPPKELFVDHINRNGLDNRKKNLRIVTHSQNHFNEKLRIDNKSGEKGVYYSNNHKKWMVSAGRKYLGIFSSKDEAIKMRKEFLKNIFS